MFMSDDATVRSFVALIGAGFRRYSTYRQATIAGIFTNTVFGFLNCSVLLAVVHARGGPVAGYSASQLATLVWINQGLLATVGAWSDIGLADRIRSGDVVADLLRPIHPVLSYLGGELGRAGYQALTRSTLPMIVGALAFTLYAPQRLTTYPLFAVSVVLGVLISFACRYLVQASAFWLLDVRGPAMAFVVLSSLLGGQYVPIRFLPDWLVWTIWLGTPFPSLQQAPVDVFVERVSLPVQVGVLAVQAFWAGVTLFACVHQQRAAERRLVVQGG
jgi:ABC-2 type transport system permease protein